MNRSGGLKFDWDDENTTHIARHNVAPVEVEQVVRNSPTTLYTAIRGGETRTVCCGRTGTGRVLKVIYTVRRDRIRVVTAHEDRKLRRLL